MKKMTAGQVLQVLVDSPWSWPLKLAFFVLILLALAAGLAVGMAQAADVYPSLTEDAGNSCVQVDLATGEKVYGKPCSSISVTAHAIQIPEDRSWHVLIRTQGGTVSLIKGLTKKEAEHTAAKLQGVPYTAEEIAADKKRQARIAADVAKCEAENKKAPSGSLLVACGVITTWGTQASDIQSVEVFQ